MDRTAGNYSPLVQEAIRRRATELYQRSGAAKGHDVENWYRAEAESSGKPPSIPFAAPLS